MRTPFIAAAGLVLITQVTVVPPAQALTPSCTTDTPALEQTVTCSGSTLGEIIAVPAGAQTVMATVLGSGGGGGGATNRGVGGIGASGARIVATFNVTGTSSITISIGGPGTGGSGAQLTPASGGNGGPSRITSLAGDLVVAGGGGGGQGASDFEVGNPGTLATGSVAAGAISSTIQLGNGGAGGAGGSAGACTSADGGPGIGGSVALTFYGPNASAPSNDERGAPSPAPIDVRSFVWRGLGSGSSSGTFTEGTWQNTPSATEWTLPGQTLLGWATDPQFPVSIAQRATGAYDGVIDGRRMIFIPAGKPTFVSGDASLHAIWAPANRTQLIGRC